MPYQVLTPAEAPRSLWAAVKTGFAQRCPQCASGRLFGRYLKVNEACPRCGEALHHQRADDAPPYFTIMIVGHIIVPLMLAVEQRYAPSEWVHAALWIPLTFLLSLTLLPRIKGALIGFQWAKRMHGFGGRDD